MLKSVIWGYPYIFLSSPHCSLFNSLPRHRVASVCSQSAVRRLLTHRQHHANERVRSGQRKTKQQHSCVHLCSSVNETTLACALYRDRSKAAAARWRLLLLLLPQKWQLAAAVPPARLLFFLLWRAQGNNNNNKILQLTLECLSANFI